MNLFDNIRGYFSHLNGSKIFSLIAFLVIVAAVPFTIYLARTQQDTRQRASETAPTPPLCQAVPTDTMLIIDTSGSMGYDVDSNGRLTNRPNDKLVKAKQAAQLFIDKLSTDNRNRVGLVPFSTDFSLASGLTQDFQTVRTRIGSLQPVGATCTRCGIKGAKDNVAAQGRPDIKKVAILLTDGRANTVYWSDPTPSTALPPATQTPAPSVALTPPPTCGGLTCDINGDGTVDVADQQLLGSCYLKQTAVGECKNTDVNCDGRFDAIEYTNISKSCSSEFYGRGVRGASDSVLGEFDQEQEGVGASSLGNTKSAPPAVAEAIAMEAAQAAKRENGIIFYVVGLGSDVNTEFLRNLAHATGGEYFFAENSNQLEGIYQQIYQISGRGSVNGSVYLDNDNSGSFNTGDTKVSDAWNVKLKQGTNIIGTATTSSGDYSITNICDGNYEVSQELKTGFVQTEPANSGSHAITIQNGSSLTNKNFGNRAGASTLTPSPSPSPSVSPSITLTVTPSVTITGTPSVGQSTIELDLKLQGISSESGTSENNNPKNPTKTVTVEIFNSAETQGQDLADTLAGTVTFDRQTGTFRGSIPLSDEISSGVYAIRVTLENKYLKKLINNVSGQPIHRIAVGRPVRTQRTTVIVGDINGDNKLNAQDYQIWAVCYNKSVTTPIPLSGIDDTCEIADLNDDGEVDHQKNIKQGIEASLRDYQWLFNSFQVQQGD